jgi:hypothetical protein
MSDDKDDKKEFKVEFAPGCFDDFDGTQEELDELMSEIMAKIKDGSFLEDSEPVDLDELPEEVREKMDQFFDDQTRSKKLN